MTFQYKSMSWTPLLVAQLIEALNHLYRFCFFFISRLYFCPTHPGWGLKFLKKLWWYHMFQVWYVKLFWWLTVVTDRIWQYPSSSKTCSHRATVVIVMECTVYKVSPLWQLSVPSVQYKECEF